MNAQQRRANLRVIGPIPPRDKQGRLMIPQQIEKRPKLNSYGEPHRDDKGRVVEIDVDVIAADYPLTYRLYEQGMQPREGATSGLSLFDVFLEHRDPSSASGPIYRVWAKDEAHAEKVFKVESGADEWTENNLKVLKVK